MNKVKKTYRSPRTSAITLQHHSPLLDTSPAGVNTTRRYYEKGVEETWE